MNQAINITKPATTTLNKTVTTISTIPTVLDNLRYITNDIPKAAIQFEIQNQPNCDPLNRKVESK